MANDRDVAGDRHTRLEQVRAEIEREVAAAEHPRPRRVGAAASDLCPELATMLVELGGIRPIAETIALGTASANPSGEETAIATGLDLTEELAGVAGATRPRSPPRTRQGPRPRRRPPALAGTRTLNPTQTRRCPPRCSRDRRGTIRSHRAHECGTSAITNCSRCSARGGWGSSTRPGRSALNRSVALKLIRNAEFAGEDQLRRFQNEAEAVALLDHPGIVPIYEVGDHEDQRYFSMKLIEGGASTSGSTDFLEDPQSRGQARRRRGRGGPPRAPAGHPPPRPQAGQHPGRRPGPAARHRLRPGQADRRRVELTVSGAILGTPAYMAPEQATAGRGSQVTTATDVYGLGAILYALLTGPGAIPRRLACWRPWSRSAAAARAALADQRRSCRATSR